MKTSKEMADAVFRIRDEYTEKKRRRVAAFKKAAVIGVPVFAALALMIGVGAAFDRQEIIPGGTPEAVMETAPVTSAVTKEELIGAAPGKTNALKDAAETSRAAGTVKETKSGTSPAAEETLPETVIPEWQPTTSEEPVEGAAPVITTTTAVMSVTTTTIPCDGQAEIVAVPQHLPDDDTETQPADPGTTNEAAALTFDTLCDMYPTLYVAGDYVCTGETVTADKLGGIVAEMAVEGSAGYAAVYSLEAGQIAVKFGETDFYIVYKAKEV